MADDSGSVRMAIGTAVGGASIALLAGASCWLGMKAYRDGRFSRGWRRVRVWALGGVTTLTRTLNYTCTMCQDSMEAGEKVRTLSCCKNMRIDQRVLSATRLLLTRPILMITRILKNVKAPRSAQGPGAWPSQIGGSLAPSGMCNISWRCAWIPYQRRKTPIKF